MSRIGFLFLGLQLFLFTGCTFPTGNCDEQIKPVVSSPNGTIEAVLFQQNCGATTPFVTQVNLRKKGATFQTVDGAINEGKVFAAKDEAAGYKLVWTDANHLVIECSGCSSAPAPFLSGTWQNVTITIRDLKIGASSPGR